MDFTRPQTFDNRTYDWVMCINVGELIPKRYEAVFVENVLKTAREGVVFFWGIKRPERTHIPNQKDGLEVIETVTKHGFTVNDDLTMDLVVSSYLPWFKIGGLFVFIKNSYLAELKAEPVNPFLYYDY
jgi:tryptophanyl-tRNA synthetase